MYMCFLTLEGERRCIIHVQIVGWYLLNQIPDQGYPPGNKSHIPPGEKKNHRLKRAFLFTGRVKWWMIYINEFRTVQSKHDNE